MTKITAVQLSARAATACVVFSKMQEEVGAIGWQAVHDKIHAEAARLDPEVRVELRSFLGQIRPETPEQATRNACRVLEQLDGGDLVASILASNDGSPAEVAMFLEGEIATLAVPVWVKDVIRKRIEAERERAKPQPKAKTVTPTTGAKLNADPTPLFQMNALLEKMKNGEWVFALACRLMEESKAVTDDSLQAAFEAVLSERQACFEKCRGPAGSILEDLGRRVAAEALYQEPHGALDALTEVRRANNVPAWIKGMVGFRIGQLEAVARERKQIVEEAQVLSDVERFLQLLDRAKELVVRAGKFPSMAVQCLGAIEAAYNEAADIPPHLPVLERIVAGKGPKDNCVARRLANDLDLTAAVAGGVKEGKGATKFRFGVLGPVRDAIAQLRREIEEASKPAPIGAGQKGNGKKPKKPVIWKNVEESSRRNRR